MNTKNAPVNKAEERAELQRHRILDAAQHCFIEHGFHAASMASIAETAGMSAGLIYRYFENKNAIILAIIERQLAEARENIAALHVGGDFPPLFIDLVKAWRSKDPRVMDPVLFLEHKKTYRKISGLVPEGQWRVPIGVADVARPGDDMLSAAHIERACALLVSARESQGGVPVAVMGPQVAYFAHFDNATHIYIANEDVPARIDIVPKKI